MFTGACTKDEDCENATIETGIDNCASMPHYPQEELLVNSVEFTMENAATKESFEDETQLGNGQDNFERLGICGESSRLKDMRESFSLEKVTLWSGLIRGFLKERLDTLESLEDETQSGNLRESFSLKKVTLRSGVIRRSLEEKVAETSSCGSLDLVSDWSDLEEENGK